MIAKRFSEDDIRRWTRVNSNEVEEITAELCDVKLTDDPDVALNLRALSIAYENLGYSNVGSGSYLESLRFFALSCEVMFPVYRAFRDGVRLPRGSVSFGDFQLLLACWATGSQMLVDRLSDLLSSCLLGMDDSHDPADSVFLALLLLYVTIGDVERARKLAAGPIPTIDPRFRGYSDCLISLATKDKGSFDSAIVAASASWDKYVRRAERGLPYSVFFLHGAGFVRLARRLFVGHIPEVSQIPLELLEVALETEVNPGLDVY